MAFVSNNSQQLSLMDSTFNLTERERGSLTLLFNIPLQKSFI